MGFIEKDLPGQSVLLMGNEAIARGAIEAGVKVCAAYPGNPSSEIIDSLARVGDALGIYVEWSVNEKVAMEVAAAASFAGIRSLTAMKQNGLNVASDFLSILNLTGSKGGFVIVVCDDPAALSSGNEQDTRAFAKMFNLPLLEPSLAQEAKEMTRWAFDLSEKLGVPCMIRSVTRVSHARSNVQLGRIKKDYPQPRYDTSRPFIPMPVVASHEKLNAKLSRCLEFYDQSPFNYSKGPEQPEIVIVTSGAGWLYCQDAVLNLKAEDRVKIVKIGTAWPLPEKFLLGHLKKAKKILFVEEVDPFLEDNIKAYCAQMGESVGLKTFLGKASGTTPRTGEMNPDVVTAVLQRLLEVPYQSRPDPYAEEARKILLTHTPVRQLGFCGGCPHRATYWAIKNALALDGREGFVLGDIGCYSLGARPAGYALMKTSHAMGSGTGLANGFGQLEAFGLKQPVIAICGDSTFYHAAIPPLINAVQHKANFLMLILDNSATAMTGFQPHPGTGRTAMGISAPIVNIEAICTAIGARVEIQDPFNVPETIGKINRLLSEDNGVRVLILKQECALIRSKRQKLLYQVRVDGERCRGDACGCNRFCLRIFKCPALFWNEQTGKALIDEAICTGCGVCADICPQSAIRREEMRCS